MCQRMMGGNIKQWKRWKAKGEKVKVREKLFEWFDVPEIKTFLEGTVGKDGVRRGGIYGKDGLATVFPKWITEILGTGGTLEASFALSFKIDFAKNLIPLRPAIGTGVFNIDFAVFLILVLIIGFKSISVGTCSK